MDKPLLIYLAILWLLALALTAYDKAAARQGGWRRVPEWTLLLVGALGGSLPMYVLMRLIRHKTRHKMFMLGLPILILLQGAALAYFRFFAA